VARERHAGAERAYGLKHATVTLQSSGRAFEVAAEESVLAGAVRAGINLPHSCRRGSCQSCLAHVVAGTVRYPGGRPSGLSAVEEAAGYALLCQAHVTSNALLVDAHEIVAGDDVRIHRVPCRVERLERLADDVMALYLRLPPVIPFRFAAGQYLDVMRLGRRHSFSIASPPHDAGPIELHVRHVAGGEFTDHVFGGLEEKALLRIEGPLGGFYFRDESRRPVLMMAGGTGFAPIKSMLRHVFETGRSREIHFYWGARARCDLYADALLARWAAQHERFSYTPVLSEPHARDEWHGRTGWVHEALVRDYPDLGAYELYMAGPPPMIEAARVEFARHGLPREHLHFDSFEFAEPARAVAD
jgi:CDP-4-dehydro-6-deoxyglucose reductase